MTNKEKYERVKFYTNQRDIVGMLGSFLVDDAYKDINFIKYIKEIDPTLFYGFHNIIIEELEEQQKVMTSCAELLKCDKLSDSTKAKIAVQATELAEKCRAIVGAAKELSEIFAKAEKGM